MNCLTKEDKKYIQQVLFEFNSANTRNQGYWDMMDEIENAEITINKTKRQQDILNYIDIIGGNND